MASPVNSSRPLSYEDVRRAIGLVFTLLLAAALIAALGKILLLFVIVFLVAMVLNPLVTGLEKRGINRGLAALATLFMLVLIVVLVLWLVVPPVAAQMEDLFRRLPTYWDSVRAQSEGLTERYPALDQAIPEVESLNEAARQQASRAGSWLLRSTFGLLGTLFLGVLALLLLIFTLTNPQDIIAGLLSLVPDSHRPATERVIARSLQQMTGWTRATLINGAVTGLSTGILLHLVGVQPALVFGTLAFFGEFVPNLGPLVAAVPTLFVALANGPSKLLAAGLVILFVQQIESNLLVPYIMGRQLKLHPLTIVFFALGMAALFDIPGAVMAVPMAVITKISIEEFYLLPRQLRREELDATARAIVRGEYLVAAPETPPAATASVGDDSPRAEST